MKILPISLGLFTLVVGIYLVDVSQIDVNCFAIELEFFKVVEVLIAALAACGTLWAVRTSLTYHTREKTFRDLELKEQIVKTMLYEIVMNYTSIYTAGMMEIFIEDSQYRMYKANLHIFHYDDLYIVELGPKITQLYNLFRFYEHTWRNEQQLGYSYKVYEAKFKVKVYLLKLLRILKIEDEEIDATLSYLLLRYKVDRDPSLAVNHRPVVKYILAECGVDYFKIFKDGHSSMKAETNHEIIVSLFEEYIDKKYSTTKLNIPQLLANLLDRR